MLSEAYEAAGDSHMQLQMIEETMRLRKVYPSDHPTVLACAMAIGRVHERLQQARAASEAKEKLAPEIAPAQAVSEGKASATA
jgi:hypothetical protein